VAICAVGGELLGVVRADDDGVVLSGDDANDDTVRSFMRVKWRMVDFVLCTAQRKRFWFGPIQGGRKSGTMTDNRDGDGTQEAKITLAVCPTTNKK
jgi:hypothetical protein